MSSENIFSKWFRVGITDIVVALLLIFSGSDGIGTVVAVHSVYMNIPTVHMDSIYSNTANNCYDDGKISCLR